MRPKLSSAPIFVQVLLLVVVSLVAAQVINLGVVLFLPDPPPLGYSVPEAARALKGEAVVTTQGQKLKVRLQPSEPRLTASPHELARFGIAVNQDGVRRSALELLRYPEVTLSGLAALWPELAGLDPLIVAQVETDGRYAGYVARQADDIAAFRRDESLFLPLDLDYAAVGGLSTEMRQKLSSARPATLGAAGRIPGVTPAALVALLRHVRRQAA